MNTTKIEDLDSFANSEKVDKVLAWQAASAKCAWISAGALTGGGVCGRKWSLTQSSPVAAGATGDLDKLAVFVNLAGIGCYLVQNNHERRKLSASNHYLAATGETVVLDGTMGHYQWGTGVPLYYAPYVGADGFFHEDWDFSPIKGHYNYYIPVMSRSAAGCATIDRTNGNLVSYVNSMARYRGGNNDASLDNAYNSQLTKPASNITAAAFAAAARLNGARWEANWYAHYFITAALTRLILGTRNIQSNYNATLDSNGLHQGGMGYGCDNFSEWGSDFANYPFINLDTGINLADGCGITSQTITTKAGVSRTINNIPVFFGLKNFYHYMWYALRGRINMLNSDHTCDCYVYEKLNSVVPSATSIADYKKVASSPAVDPGWLFPKMISYQNLCGHPTVFGATESTYFSDGYYQDNGSGLRGPIGGGTVSFGGSAGVGFVYGSAGVGWAVAGGVASLDESAEDWDTTPFFVG